MRLSLIVKIMILTYAAIAVIAAERETGMGIGHSPATSATSLAPYGLWTSGYSASMKHHTVEVLIGIAVIIASEHYRAWSSNLALHVRQVFR